MDYANQSGRMKENFSGFPLSLPAAEKLAHSYGEVPSLHLVNCVASMISAAHQIHISFRHISPQLKSNKIPHHMCHMQQTTATHWQASLTPVPGSLKDDESLCVTETLDLYSRHGKDDCRLFKSWFSYVILLTLRPQTDVKFSKNALSSTNCGSQFHRMLGLSRKLCWMNMESRFHGQKK